MWIGDVSALPDLEAAVRVETDPLSKTKMAQYLAELKSIAAKSGDIEPQP